jgi:hypothetical protein
MAAPLRLGQDFHPSESGGIRSRLGPRDSDCSLISTATLTAARWTPADREDDRHGTSLISVHQTTQRYALDGYRWDS